MAAKKFIDIIGAEYVADQVNLRAPIESPVFTGTPKVPTANNGNSSKQVANTEFVQNTVMAYLSDLKGHVDTYADLPSSPVPTVGDTYFVDNDTIGTGTAETPEYPAGYYRWDGTEWDPIDLGSDIEFFTSAEVEEMWNEIINPTTPVTP